MLVVDVGFSGLHTSIYGVGGGRELNVGNMNVHCIVLVLVVNVGRGFSAQQSGWEGHL